MSEPFAIHTEHLDKTFGKGKRRVNAVVNLSLQVPAGQVYGFLGPNGAGKSTTIRMLLDLIYPTKGETFIFGKPVRRHRDILKRVGALVEGATLYPYMTGKQNLEVLAHTQGHLDPQRIRQVLELVGMDDRADRPARGYSTGMKQRIGVAAALLSNPDLIILDEPTNGLDPAGIQEMRQIIRNLVDKDGKTVFLSSHMLNEVEQICDQVAIIQRGQLIRAGAVDTLLNEQRYLRVEVEPLQNAFTVLSERWPTEQADGHLRVKAGREMIPALVEHLVSHHLSVYEVSLQRQSLEEFFLSVTTG